MLLLHRSEFEISEHVSLASDHFLCDPSRQVKVPMLIMPSGEDPDHLPVKEVLDKKPFGNKCQYRRFDDMHHGFCAARYAYDKTNTFHIPLPPVDDWEFRMVSLKNRALSLTGR